MNTSNNQTFEKYPKASEKGTDSLKEGEPKITINLPKPNSTTSPLENPISLLNKNNSLESNNFSFTSKIENKLPIVDKTGSLYNLIRLPGAYLAVAPKRSEKHFMLRP